VQPVNFKVLYAFCRISQPVLPGNQLWNEAASMKFQPGFPWEKFPWQKGIVHFTRSLGAARSGDLESAKTEWKNCNPFMTA
jgi:hypothetical protein